MTGLVHDGELVAIDPAGRHARGDARCRGAGCALSFAAMSLLCLAGALLVFASGLGHRSDAVLVVHVPADRVVSSKVARVAVRGGLRALRPAAVRRASALVRRAPVWVIVAALALMLACGALVVCAARVTLNPVAVACGLP